MTTMVAKTVNFLGKDVTIKIPSKMDLLVWDEEYFGNFDLGGNLVLHVEVRTFIHLENIRLQSSQIIISISTKEGICVSKSEPANPIPNEKLFERLLHEIDRTVDSFSHDFSVAYKKAESIFSSLKNVNDDCKIV